MEKNKASVSEAVERDLRLDFFRGLGLWMIFLDHIPDDVVSWLTLRNYGFSDAAEFFVFISGYLAGYIYGPIIQSGNFLAATKRLLVRAWHLYIAHILLFLLFTAQIARAARKFDKILGELGAVRIGELQTELIEEFMKAFVQEGRFNLHIENWYGRNQHHIAETVFKATARALRTATRVEHAEIPSTKGVL